MQLIGLIAGTVSTGVALLGAFQSWTLLLKDTIQTQGRLIEIKMKVMMGSSSADYRRYPVIQFTTLDGREITFDGPSGYMGSKKVGDPYNIRYDPDNPQDAFIDSFYYLWCTPLSVGIVGLLFLIMGFTATYP